MIARVVLEGSNGTWAQDHYLPLLLKKAVSGEIELWMIDIAEEIKLPGDDKVLWSSCVEKGNVHYLNKIKDDPTYNGIYDIDYVFVVTPDSTHCELAKHWLGRLAEGGSIFIEKPLDVEPDKGRDLTKSRFNRASVFGFDHYLARIHPLTPMLKKYLGDIGKLSEIEIRILENNIIPKGRIKALEKGVILDLSSHMLVLAAVAVTQKVTRGSFRGFIINDVKAAAYSGSEIPGETFASIDFSIGGVGVKGTLGKGVGIKDDKHVTITGSSDKIELYFDENRFSVGLKRGKLESKHVECFLAKVLSGEHPLRVPGVLDLRTSLEILELTTQMIERVRPSPTNPIPLTKYNPGDSVEKIIGLIDQNTATPSTGTKHES